MDAGSSEDIDGNTDKMVFVTFDCKDNYLFRIMQIA